MVNLHVVKDNNRMGITLRPYQQIGESDIYNAWSSGHRNVLYVLPTGGGKTFLFSNIVRKFHGETVIVAHRETLVSQISLSLAKLNVTHRILAPDKLIKEISTTHVEELERSFVDPLAIITVGAVDTMVRRLQHVEFKIWANRVKLWIIDEAHHCQKTNKWGKVLSSFQNAIGLGVTATPVRTDGNGLSSETNGMFDLMVEGPTIRDLINQGYLVPYKIYCPPSDFDISNVKITKTGEFNQKQLSYATINSTIVGDVVDHYLKYANGLRGLTFCPSVELAEIVTKKYIMEGIPAKLITASSKDRKKIIKNLENGIIKQIVSVDVLGEGVDIPSIEVCSFLRRTESLGLYIQQFGRGMRPFPGKTRVIILDHVGNVERHNLPDAFRKWTMNKREKGVGKPKTKQHSLTSCTSCFQPFNPQHTHCPWCGIFRITVKKPNPKEVDGDLLELTEEYLTKMRANITKNDAPVMMSPNHPEVTKLAIAKRHEDRKIYQGHLRQRVAQWAGNLKYLGKTDSEIYKIFFQKTGVDMLEAQTLGAKKAIELICNISPTKHVRKI